MFLVQPYSGGYGGQLYVPNAVTFDGTDDYAQKSGGLDNVSNGRTGIISAWIYGDTASRAIFWGRIQLALPPTKDTFRFVVNSSKKAELTIYDIDPEFNVLMLRIATASALTASAWNHVAFAWDVTTFSSETSHVYLNGASSQTVTTRIGGTNLSYRHTSSSTIGAAYDGSQKYSGGLAELYINLAETIDLSNSTNLEKFRSSTGRPVFLGATGNTPTGTAPAVYMKSPAATFGTNSGTGGNFNVTGTLADSAPPP